MRCLLDTSAFLWFVSDFHKLSPVASQRLQDQDSTIHLSMFSIWEVAIKFNLGKLELPLPFDEFIDATIRAYSFRVRDIQIRHIRRVARMPRHHREPFDRLLIAQSQVDGIPIISSEAAFDHYAVDRL